MKGNDESTFACTVVPSRELAYALTGILAELRASFATSRTVVPIRLPSMRQVPLSGTCGGLAMTLAAQRWEPDHRTRGMVCYMVPPCLCRHEGYSQHLFMLYLYRTSDGRMVWREILTFTVRQPAKRTLRNRNLSH